MRRSAPRRRFFRRLALRRSARASPAGGVFQEIGGAGKAFGGFGHLSGDLTGLSDVLRSRDRAEDCPDGTAVYACGPEPMLTAIRAQLAGRDNVELHFERSPRLR
jgi:ferredoxin-NADP reductase